MNILFLMGTYPSYGGVEKVSTILANEFIKRGYGVSIISFEQPFPELALLELNPTIKLFKLKKPVYTRDNVQVLTDIILKNKIDILINQWAVPFYVSMLCHQAVKKSNCKLITVHHNLPDTNARIKDIEIKIEKKIGNPYINKIKLGIVKFISRCSLRYTYRQSTRFIVLSPSFIDLTYKFIFHPYNQKIIAIPNPLTIPSPPNDEHFLKKKEIICVGRIEYNQKRTFRVIEIWKNLEPIFPDWSLKIVGDGPDRENLEQLIQEYNLKHVEITGFVNPITYYRNASLLILTSEYEGFGLVIVEGMSYQVVPIIYGSYSAVYDIIDSEKDGFISNPPFSAISMTKILRELMTNQNKRNIMAINAQQKAQKFTLSTIVDQWEKLFEQLK